MKRRRAWIAGIANLAAPLGHVYVGRPIRGIVLALLMGVVSISALLITLRPVGRITIVLMVLTLLIGYLVPITDAVILAKRETEEYTLKWYNRWYMYLLVFGIVALLGDIVKPAIRSHLVQAYKIPSGSMTPTLLIGDHILTDKTIYKSRVPKRFDIVVFEFPEDAKKSFVFRVIGLPGETIEMRDKKVLINGIPIEESHAHYSGGDGENINPKQDSFGSVLIPEQSYFVLGDNRNRSYDSRYWGPVRQDKIYGLVRIIYFSWDTARTGVRWDRVGKLVE